MPINVQMVSMETSCGVDGLGRRGDKSLAFGGGVANSASLGATFCVTVEDMNSLTRHGSASHENDGKVRGGTARDGAQLREREADVLAVQSSK